MNIIYAKDYQELSVLGAELMTKQVKTNPKSGIVLASGASPTILYQYWVQAIKEQKLSYNELRLIKLDDWAGLGATHPSTTEYDLIKLIFDPLGLKIDRTINLQSDCADLVQECERVEQALSTVEIDYCVLGIGKNGHIGFNEPKEYLTPFCHVEELTEASLGHAMVEGLSGMTQGITLGMRNIVKAKKILLVVSGKNKADIVAQLLTKKITSFLPVSFLWLHQDVTLLIDQDAASKI